MVFPLPEESFLNGAANTFLIVDTVLALVCVIHLAAENIKTQTVKPGLHVGPPLV